jgi:hypothetical protein
MPLTNIRRVKHNQVTSQLSVDALNMGHPCKLLSSIFTPSLSDRPDSGPGARGHSPNRSAGLKWM